MELVARGRGWRWPLETLELWDGSTRIADLPAALILSLVLHHLDGVALSAEVREAIRLGSAARVRLLAKMNGGRR